MFEKGDSIEITRAQRKHGPSTRDSAVWEEFLHRIQWGFSGIQWGLNSPIIFSYFVWECRSTRASYWHHHGFKVFDPKPDSLDVMPRRIWGCLKIKRIASNGLNRGSLFSTISPCKNCWPILASLSILFSCKITGHPIFNNTQQYREWIITSFSPMHPPYCPVRHWCNWIFIGSQNRFQSQAALVQSEMGTTWQTKPHKWWLGGLLMMVGSRDFEWVYFDFLRNARMVTRMDQSYLLWFWSATVPLCHGDECVTVWILLDLKRTRPKRITQSVLKAIRKKVILSLSPKISWRFRKFFLVQFPAKSPTS